MNWLLVVVIFAGLFVLTPLAPILMDWYVRRSMPLPASDRVSPVLYMFAVQVVNLVMLEWGMTGLLQERRVFSSPLPSAITDWLVPLNVLLIVLGEVAIVIGLFRDLRTRHRGEVDDGSTRRQR